MGIQYTCDDCGVAIDRATTGYYEVGEIDYIAPPHKNNDGTLVVFKGKGMDIPEDKQSWTTLSGFVLCRECWPKWGLEKLIDNGSRL